MIKAEKSELSSYAAMQFVHPRASDTVLFVDDMQDRHNDYRKSSNCDLLAAYNVPDAITLLATMRFDIVSLDHDLIPDHYNSKCTVNVKLATQCGCRIVDYITNNVDKFTNSFIVVHSWNLEPSVRMTNRLINAGLHAFRIPFNSARLIQQAVGQSEADAADAETDDSPKDRGSLI